MKNRIPRRDIPESAPPAEDSAEIIIERLAWGGEGVGRKDGQVVFVPMTAPQDRALVAVNRSRRSYSRGRLLRLVEAGPDRVSPPCPLFGDCGGCQWLHVSYEAQLREKLEILISSLRRIGKTAPPAKTSIVPSPERLGYRHRARLHADLRGGRVRIGFFRTGSHDIAPLEKCPILTPSLNAVLGMLQPVLREKGWAPADLKTVDLAADFPGRHVRLSLNGRKGLLVPPRATAEALRTLAAAAGIALALPGMEDRPLALTGDDDGPRALRSAFTQVNLRQNTALVEEVVGLSGGGEAGKTIDLFCGAGNFSLPLAAAGAEVLGIESSRPAVESARENAARMAIGNISFQRGRCEKVLGELAAGGSSFDTAVVNPPRTGGREVIPGLLAVEPDRIVMVSCDPATFSRDAALLAEGGYRLSHLRAFDLFPQTFHFETVGLFTR